MPKLFIDSNEVYVYRRWLEEMRKLGVEWEARPLPVDYYLPSAVEGRLDVYVERKSVLDLASSLPDRLREQLNNVRLAASERPAYVVIAVIGYWGLIEKQTKWNITAFYRCLEAVIREFSDLNPVVLPFPSDFHFVRWLVARVKAQEREPEIQRVPARPTLRAKLTLKDRILYVLSGVCGVKTAERLLQRFGSIRRVAEASVDELMQVEGIGEKRAKEIWEILNADWRLLESH